MPHERLMQNSIDCIYLPQTVYIYYGTLGLYGVTEEANLI